MEQGQRAYVAFGIYSGEIQDKARADSRAHASKPAFFCQIYYG